MDDQAAKLSALGLKVARIHSGLSREDSRQACRDYLDGSLNFLFIAPERMRVPGFPEMLARKKPSLVAIDEAHCISAWGHDFRPDYRMLGDYLPSLRPAPILALTATATPTVQKDIVAQLQLSNPDLFIHGFRRHNLAIEVVELSKPRRNEFTAALLNKPENRPAIVYAPSRKSAEELASVLGKKASPYHAGLAPAERERVQREFLAGNLEVVVATIAFGMGIDKADVRTVVHIALPGSVEQYYQEIGRAGRDGKPSKTVLLHSFADRKMHDFFLERDYPAPTELSRVANILTDDLQQPGDLCRRLKIDIDTVTNALNKLASQGAATFDIEGKVRSTGLRTWRSGYDAQLAFRRSQIDRMVAYADSAQCRMAALINHFGDTADGLRPCGNCDFCSPERATAQPFRAPTQQEDRQLRAILRALDASPSKSTGKLHSDLALGIDRTAFEAYLDALARVGLIAITADTFTNPEGNVINYKRASLTHEGRTRDEADDLTILLRETNEDTSTKSKSRTKKPSSRPERSGVEGPLHSARSAKTAQQETQATYTPQQQALETRLREWRKAEAAKTGKPAFIVFSDAILRNIVLAAPRNLTSLLQISGIGPEKADRFGPAIIALCTSTPVPGDYGAPATLTPRSTSITKAWVAHSSQSHRDEWEVKSSQKNSATPSLFKRTTTDADPTANLTPDQQALDHRLREWRKAESEKLGLPQFFVFGSSALRSIVLKRPRTLSELQSIPAMDHEKLEKFGADIIAVCNL